MPELIRSVVSRVRVYFKDHRQTPRLRVRLLFSIAVSRKARANGAAPQDRTLKGHTRDISASGLALMLPQIHLDGYHLAAEGRELQVTLELPTGTMPLVVIPRRYEKLEESELGCNYLIGARIVQITEEDRTRLESFIAHSLSGNVSPRDSKSTED
ncbi:MAG TPA: PilZ domain-containing protein [Pyrinomonadaceae bacterium]